MISGHVTDELDAIVTLPVKGTAGILEITAVLDTGYNGWLTLPPDVIAALGLPWRRRGRAILADGHPVIFEVYEATIIWNERPRRIPIDATESVPLLGMRMMLDCELHVQVWNGGSVQITGASH